MADPICRVDGCERPAKIKSRELCQMHYLRWRKHGDVGGAEPMYPKGRTCVVDGCIESAACKGYCSLHYVRWKRSGDAGPVHSLLLQEFTYSSAHHMVWAARGRASKYECVDCAAQAEHWSYRHGSQQGVQVEHPSGLAWVSPDPGDYEPRCISCHKRYDLGR